MTRVLVGLVVAFSLLGQIRPLHTRDLTRLSHPQVVNQLRSSDVIFIPVGAVETNGIQPGGRDYVYALSYAMMMAEQTSGLYLPGLVWSYPGTTGLAASAIYLSPEAGIEQLKQLAASLLRQGFRRQVYVSASHGPAPLTVGTMVRQFFEETHVPILYINMDTILPRLKLDANRLLYGAHSITGRLDDLSLRGDYGEGIEAAPAGLPENEGLRELGKLGFSGSLTLGSYIPHDMAHSSAGAPPADAAERERWGREGADQIRAIVRAMQLPKAMDALRQHDEFTQRYIIHNPQDLFDGKTLNGWVNEGGANFRVENGAIVVDQGPYTWLRTAKEYKDYELSLEYKTTADGNSGVFLRSAAEGKPHETGYELQIFDERKDFKTGSLVGIVEARPNRIRPNEWNTIEVRHVGPKVTVKMNGVVVVDTSDNRSLKGHIGLQFNPNKPISFRKIRLREL